MDKLIVVQVHITGVPPWESAVNSLALHYIRTLHTRVSSYYLLH